MGWLRGVGSLKLQVSFAKEPYKWDDILQKRPIIWRSLLIHPMYILSRVAKTHRMPYLYRSFSANEPYNLWLFCEKWPAKRDPTGLRQLVWLDFVLVAYSSRGACLCMWNDSLKSILDVRRAYGACSYYVHTYMYICIYKCICIHTYILTHTCMHEQRARLCVHIYMCTSFWKRNHFGFCFGIYIRIYSSQGAC